MTAADREYEIEDDSPRLPSTALRTRPVRVITDEWLATRDAELVESIAAGFDTRALQARINGALDPAGRDIDAVLAWECAARWIREHAAGRPSASVEPQTSPGGTPEPRRAPRLVPYADRAPLYAAYKAAREWAEQNGEDCTDDGIIQAAVKAYEAERRAREAAGPATSPTGGPT